MCGTPVFAENRHSLTDPDKGQQEASQLSQMPRLCSVSVDGGRPPRTERAGYSVQGEHREMARHEVRGACCEMLRLAS